LLDYSIEVQLCQGKTLENPINSRFQGHQKEETKCKK